MVIKYYSGALMYTNLYANSNFESRYGPGMIPVSLKEFQTCPVHNSDDVKDSNLKNTKFG